MKSQQHRHDSKAGSALISGVSNRTGTDPTASSSLTIAASGNTATVEGPPAALTLTHGANHNNSPMDCQGLDTLLKHLPSHTLVYEVYALRVFLLEHLQDNSIVVMPALTQAMCDLL